MAEIDTEVKKWGNSLGVRLPRDLLKGEGIRAGDRVHLSVEKRAAPTSKFWGLGKRHRARILLSYEESKAEERQQERARDRRVGRS